MGIEHDGAQFSILGVELIPKPDLEEASIAGSLTLDQSITPHLGLELDAGYDPRLGEPFEAAVTTATAGLIYHVNPADAGVLYLAMGGGAVWCQAIDTRGNNNVTATGSAAIRAKIYFGAGIILRLELRYFTHRLQLPIKTCSGDAPWGLASDFDALRSMHFLHVPLTRLVGHAIVAP